MALRRIVVFLLGTVVILLWLGSWFEIRQSYDHNENMYVAAGVLASQGETLYRDFAYLQTPYLPLAYGVWF